MRKWGIIVGVNAMVVCGNAQWIPAGPPDPWIIEIIQEAGITYSRVTTMLPAGMCCQRIAAYPPARQGSTFTQTVQLETWGGACIGLFCDARYEDAVSVLGALSPGNYHLIQTAEGLPTPWFVVDFGVFTNSYPTMVVTPATNDPSMTIQINGIPKVLYVLENSTDLIQWTALATNMTASGSAPITFSIPRTHGSYGFYRTQIMQAPLRAGL